MAESKTSVAFETERLLVRPLHPTDFDNLNEIDLCSSVFICGSLFQGESGVH